MLSCCNNGFLSINSSEHVIWGDPSLKDFHRNRLHCEVGIIKNHGFAVPRCWHHNSSYVCFIMMLASKRIISLRSQSRAPAKWPARWLLINCLIFLSFLIFKPPCYISRLAYAPIFTQVCEPVSQKVCGTVEVAVPRYYHQHQTTSNLVHSCTILLYN